MDASFLTPVKITGGVGEMSESIFRARPRTHPLIGAYTLD